MNPKPPHMKASYAESFQDTSVAESYRFRPEYPPELFHHLIELAKADSPAILDAGAGTGDLARPLAALVNRVDAIDISKAMIDEGRRLPGGDSIGLTWIHSALESAELSPPYDLVTAGESMHWMDWDTVFPLFRQALVPGGYVAMVKRHWLLADPRELEIVRRHSLNQEFQPVDLVTELESRGLFRSAGDRFFGPYVWRIAIDDFITARHSQASFSLERMSAESASAFDMELRELLEELFPTGLCEIDVSFPVVWGEPMPPDAVG